MEVESIRARCVRLTVMSFMVAMTIVTGVALCLIVPAWKSTGAELTIISLGILFVVLATASGILCWIECKKHESIQVRV